MHLIIHQIEEILLGRILYSSIELTTGDEPVELVQDVFTKVGKHSFRSHC